MTIPRMTRIKRFLSWMFDAADERNTADARALAVAEALAWFHQEVLRISVSDYGPNDGWAAIAELYNDPRYMPLSDDPEVIGRWKVGRNCYYCGKPYQRAWWLACDVLRLKPCCSESCALELHQHPCQCKL
jgi:hypothetical protein